MHLHPCSHVPFQRLHPRALLLFAYTISPILLLYIASACITGACHCRLTFFGQTYPICFLHSSALLLRCTCMSDWCLGSCGAVLMSLWEGWPSGSWASCLAGRLGDWVCSITETHLQRFILPEAIQVPIHMAILHSVYDQVSRQLRYPLQVLVKSLGHNPLAQRTRAPH